MTVVFHPVVYNLRVSTVGYRGTGVPSTYHLLQARRLQGMRAVIEIADTQGVIYKVVQI
jgi:hypothetical protein